MKALLVGWLGILVVSPLLLNSPAHGQSAIPAKDGIQTQKAEFLAVREQLLREMETVRRSSARSTPGAQRHALDEWRTQNAARFESLKEQAVQLGKASSPVFVPLIRRVQIPANATPELEELLVGAAQIRNDQAALRNQALQSRTQTPQALEAGLEADPGRLEMQSRLALVVAEQGRQKTVFIPDTPLIPRDATPELRAFMTERHALLRERAELEKQSIRLTPEVREQALAQWQQNNGARFQSLAAKARTLSAQNSNPRQTPAFHEN